MLAEFNEASARRRLLSPKVCTKVTLNSDQQHYLSLEVGINVTEEHPWRQVRKQLILDYLPEGDDIPTEVSDLREKLEDFDDDDLIIVCYVSALSTEESDTFAFFANAAAVKDIGTLIQQFEACGRQKLKKLLYKRARPWKSHGSENEVNLQLEKLRTNKVEVEIQRLCSNQMSHRTFDFRLAGDVRDGYVELVPRKDDIRNLERKRIDIGIQTAPRRINVEQQTDPTFPANAWTQYFYEVIPEGKQMKSLLRQESVLIEF